MALSPSPSPSLALASLPPPPSCLLSRSFLSIRCGPRDNRGPLLKGRILSSEAIQSIQSLKRAHRTGSLTLSLPPLRRLLKSDLISVLRELLRQDKCTIALHVLSTLCSEYPPIDLGLYAEVVNALSRSGELNEIDRLVGDLSVIPGDYDRDKALLKLLKAVLGAGRRDSAVRIYAMMRDGGWGSASWEADEYVTEVLSKGLRRLGEEELAVEVANKRKVIFETDCKELTIGLSKETKWASLENIAQEVEAIHGDFDIFSIRHTSRNANKVADKLAKFAKSFSTFDALISLLIYLLLLNIL